LTPHVIQENIHAIRGRISDACGRAGRNASDITLIAVSKTFGTPEISAAADAGCADFGENYIQEIRGKQEALTGRGIRWHFIGHLQTNKIRYIAEWIHLIHSVDSLRLARAISDAAVKAGRTIPFLVEVNTTSESSKFGIKASETTDFVAAAASLPSVRVDGLMTMGPFSDEPEDSRGAFRTLREAAEKARYQGYFLPHLSMGMTGDFEVAIEEGATMIRVGTAIFGARAKPGVPAQG
jgi:pyridoxal phosphate enzyme (YggS family)